MGRFALFARESYVARGHGHVAARVCDGIGVYARLGVLVEVRWVV